jgi:hypothetical protein
VLKRGLLVRTSCGGEGSLPLIFVDEDAEYLHWVSEHPDGYVINTYRKPSSNYLVLHRAECFHITVSFKERTTAWTRDYIKICAHDRDDLGRWAAEFTGSQAIPCKTCQP